MSTTTRHARRAKALRELERTIATPPLIVTPRRVAMLTLVQAPVLYDFYLMSEGDGDRKLYRLSGQDCSGFRSAVPVPPAYLAVQAVAPRKYIAGDLASFEAARLAIVADVRALMMADPERGSNVIVDDFLR